MSFAGVLRRRRRRKQGSAKWIEGDEYREPMALLDGEVPADLIARVVEESHNGTAESTAS